MNIFVVSDRASENANMLDDKRLIKMILETTQMLNTAVVDNYGEEHSMGYKPTHRNHPCTKWVGSRRSRYLWACSLLGFMLLEYTNRFGKVHKCEEYTTHFFSKIELFPLDFKEIEPYENCATDFKAISDTFEAYKMQLIKKWNEDKIPPKWTNTEKPEWYY